MSEDVKIQLAAGVALIFYLVGNVAAAKEGLLPFMLACIIIPWGVIKGVITFFGMVIDYLG